MTQAPASPFDRFLQQPQQAGTGTIAGPASPSPFDAPFQRYFGGQGQVVQPPAVGPMGPPKPEGYQTQPSRGPAYQPVGVQQSTTAPQAAPATPQGRPDYSAIQFAQRQPQGLQGPFTQQAIPEQMVMAEGSRGSSKATWSDIASLIEKWQPETLKQEALKGLGRGVVRTAEMVPQLRQTAKGLIRGGVEAIAGESGGPSVPTSGDIADRFAIYMAQSAIKGPLAPTTDEGAFPWSDPRWWAGQAGEQVVNLATLAIPGAAMIKGAQAVGYSARAAQALGLATTMATSAALETSSTREDLRSGLIERGMEESDADTVASMGAAGYGVVAGILEVLPMSQLLKVVPGGKKQIGRILKTAAAEAITERGQEAAAINTEAILGVSDPTEDLAGRMNAATALGGVMGGGAAMATQPILGGARAQRGVPSMQRVRSETPPATPVESASPDAEATTSAVPSEQTGNRPPSETPPSPQPVQPSEPPAEPTRAAETVKAEESLKTPSRAVIHGTTVNAASQIESDGFLQATIGENARQAYEGNYAAAGVEMPNGVYATSALAPQRAITAMRVQIGNMLNKPMQEVTLEDVRQHGAIVIADRDDFEFASPRKEGYGYGESLAESGDFYSTVDVGYSGILRGNALVAYLEKKNLVQGLSTKGASDAQAEQAEVAQTPAGQAASLRQTESPEGDASGIVDAGADAARGDVESLKYPELRQRAKDMGLSAVGSVKVLRERIRGVQESPQAPAADEAQESPSGIAEPSQSSEGTSAAKAADTQIPAVPSEPPGKGRGAEPPFSKGEDVWLDDFNQQTGEQGVPVQIIDTAIQFGEPVVKVRGGSKWIKASRISKDKPTPIYKLSPDELKAVQRHAREQLAPTELKQPAPAPPAGKQAMPSIEPLNEQQLIALLPDDRRSHIDKKGNPTRRLVKLLIGSEHGLTMEELGGKIKYANTWLKALREHGAARVVGFDQDGTPRWGAGNGTIQTKSDVDVLWEKVRPPAPAGQRGGEGKKKPRPRRGGFVNIESIEKTIRAAVKGGQWTARQVQAGAYWLYYSKGADTFAKARSLIEATFGNIAPKWVQRMWKVAKDFAAGAADMSQLAGKPVSPEIVAKIARAITQAKPIRKTFEAMKKVERSERAAKMRSAQEKVGGKAALFASLSAQKGEFQRPEQGFEPLGDVLTEAEQDAIYDHIWTHELGGAPQARMGIASVMRNIIEHGYLPTEGEIQTIERLFGKQLAKALLTKKLGRGKMALRAFIEIWNIPKALKASWDVSALGRQGLLETVAHPWVAKDAAADMLRAFKSESFARDVDRRVRNSPFYENAIDDGLYLPEITGGLSMSEREEMFISRVLQENPVLRVLTRPSERAYLTYLNLMRANAYELGHAELQARGMDREQHEAAYKQLAKLINAATGRGNVNMGELAVWFNSLFFSPRLMWANFEYPTRAIGAIGGRAFGLQDRAVAARMAARQIVSTGMFILMVAGLVKALGWLDDDIKAEVETNPKSTDFLKAKLDGGQTTIDLTGGRARSMSMLTQLITGKYEAIGEKEQKRTPLWTAALFFGGKLSPSTRVVMSILEGKRFGGKPVTVGGIAADLLVPISFETIKEVVDEHGMTGLWLMAPETLGFGVTVKTYNPDSDSASYHYNAFWEAVRVGNDELAEKVIDNMAKRGTKQSSLVRSAKSRGLPLPDSKYLNRLPRP